MSELSVLYAPTLGNIHFFCGTAVSGTCRTQLQVGTQQLRNLDPFLMLDELRCPAKEAAAGFPDHPHRGFETCSIMLQGNMEHKDSAGNSVCPVPGCLFS